MKNNIRIHSVRAILSKVKLRFSGNLRVWVESFIEDVVCGTRCSRCNKPRWEPWVVRCLDTPRQNPPDNEEPVRDIYRERRGVILGSGKSRWRRPSEEDNFESSPLFWCRGLFDSPLMSPLHPSKTISSKRHIICYRRKNFCC